MQDRINAAGNILRYFKTRSNFSTGIKKYESKTALSIPEMIKTISENCLYSAKSRLVSLN